MSTAVSPLVPRLHCVTRRLVLLLVLLVASAARAGTLARRLELPGFGPRERQAVQRSVELAARQLRQSDCLKVFSEFQLPNGSTPLENLRATGLTAEEFLYTLNWENGVDSPRCDPGALLATTLNSRRVFVCPGFARMLATRPAFGSTLVIHEQLHALGLGENPPTSLYITARVFHWCR